MIHDLPVTSKSLQVRVSLPVSDLPVDVIGKDPCPQDLLTLRLVTRTRRDRAATVAVTVTVTVTAVPRRPTASSNSESDAELEYLWRPVRQNAP
jgi:hypothetical protein